MNFYVNYDETTRTATYSSNDIGGYLVGNLKQTYYEIKDKAMYLKPDNDSDVIVYEDSNLNYFFAGWASIKECDFSKFDFSNFTGTQMHGAFQDDPDLELIEGLKIDNITGISRMFYGNYGYSSINLDLVMKNCSFASATSLCTMFLFFMGRTLDISGVKFGTITDISYMFNGASNLTTIYVSDDLYSPSIVSSYGNTFINCNNIVGGAGTTFTDTSGTHAIIDNGTNGGYLTYKAATGISVKTNPEHIGCEYSISYVDEVLSRKSYAIVKLKFTETDAYKFNEFTLSTDGTISKISGTTPDAEGYRKVRFEYEEEKNYILTVNFSVPGVYVEINPEYCAIVETTIIEEAPLFKIVQFKLKERLDDYSFESLDIYKNGDLLLTEEPEFAVGSVLEKVLRMPNNYKLVFNFVDNTPYKPSGGLDGGDTIEDEKPSSYMEYSNNPMTEIAVPTDAQLSEFAGILFGESFAENVVYNILNINLTDIVQNLMVLPFSINKNIQTRWYKVGFWKTGIQMNFTSKNYYEISCGKITVPKLYPNSEFLDYQADIKLFLPFIGYVSMEVFDVIGKEVEPVYQVDLATGTCICKLFIDGSCKYQFTGDCAYHLPVSGIDALSVGIKPLANIGLSIATAGSGAGAAFNGGGAEAGMGLMKNYIDPFAAKEGASGVSNDSALSRIGTILSMSNGSARGSNLGGNSGFLSINKPYFIISRPIPSIPDDFAHFNGLPCNKTKLLAETKGFTVIQDVHIENIACTEAERDEISNLLRKGVRL